MKYAIQNMATEWAYVSGKAYQDPFNDVQLDVVVTTPNGHQQTVPAFWAGENVWRVRYAATQVGAHHYRSICSDSSNADLHGQEDILEITPYTGNNPLLAHGTLRVGINQRHLEHADGTPFFWLADTWWMGFCKRLKWPEEFHELAADRVAKGFNVIQIIAGLYPDMPWHDERGANEAGFPWDKNFTRINPAYFDMMDLRIAHMVSMGLLPCIAGFWGYFLDFTSFDVLKKHWRYLIARYSAYPVIWCAAGEALMPYYQSADFERMLGMLAKGEHWLPADRRATWSELLRYIRALDPAHHPLTIHPMHYGHDQIDDPSLMDIDWLQTGHGSHRSLPGMVDMVEVALAHEPKMPVLVSEGNFEGILESSREEVQRFMFWAAMLSGAMGHTYGANGVWQVNRKEQPYGPSPHGLSWGDRPWNEAYPLPGSAQMGVGKQFFERYPWWQFEPHPEWIEPHHTKDNRFAPYAAGIPGKVRVIFLPVESIRMTDTDQPVIGQLELGVSYRAFYVNPSNGAETECGAAMADADGNYRLPKASIFRDWVFVLECK